ncbi:MAG: hypothetical protein ACE5GT_12185 [Rhodospirillales bacterium]
MPLSRDQGKILQAVEQDAYKTCSASGTAAVTETSVNGRIIDRLGDELLRRYRTVEPFAYLFATRGSTEADRKLTLGVHVQHGDSSGGGDMADYSTGSQAATRTFFTSAGTTPMGGWSTGVLYGQSDAAYYDLTAAKRFVRGVLHVKKNRITTETSGDEGMLAGAMFRFGGAEELPDRANTTGAGSTSTTT